MTNASQKTAGICWFWLASCCGLTAASAQPEPKPKITIKPSPTSTAYCVPEEVAVWQNRIHIRCGYTLRTQHYGWYAGNADVRVNVYDRPLNELHAHPAYFALPLTSPMAASVAALASAMAEVETQGSFNEIGTRQTGLARGNIRTASRTNAYLAIEYRPGDTSGASFGCLAKDCRVPLTVRRLSADPTKLMNK